MAVTSVLRALYSVISMSGRVDSRRTCSRLTSIPLNPDAALAFPARSYPGILPLAHVDHIYYDSPLEAVKVSIHRTRLALIASYHLPVVAEFAYEPT